MPVKSEMIEVKPTYAFICDCGEMNFPPTNDVYSGGHYHNCSKCGKQFVLRLVDGLVIQCHLIRPVEADHAGE